MFSIDNLEINGSCVVLTLLIETGIPKCHQEMNNTKKPMPWKFLLLHLCILQKMYSRFALQIEQCLTPKTHIVIQSKVTSNKIRCRIYMIKKKSDICKIPIILSLTVQYNILKMSLPVPLCTPHIQGSRAHRHWAFQRQSDVQEEHGPSSSLRTAGMTYQA